MSTSRHVLPIEQWKDPRQRLGMWGEQVALAYLSAQGWTIHAHRFRFARHDVDVVARSGALVAFIEVKTRRTSAFGNGFEAVDRRKQRILVQGAEIWRLRFGRPGDIYRFDVIAVYRLGQDRYQVEHLEDAWR